MTGCRHPRGVRGRHINDCPMKIEDKGDRRRIRLSAGREAWLFRFVMMNLFARQHIVDNRKI